MLTRGLRVLAAASVAAGSLLSTDILLAPPVGAHPSEPPCHVEQDANGIWHEVCETDDRTTSAGGGGAGSTGAEGSASQSPNSTVVTSGDPAVDSSGSEDNVAQGGFPTPYGGCIDRPYASTPPGGVAITGTEQPGSVVMFCPGNMNGDPGGFYYWSNPPAAPPPVDLTVLSRQARADLVVPGFGLVFGPDSQRLAVNMPTRFTAQPEASLNPSASASDQGLTVTVTGALVGMSWSPGEPAHCTAGDFDASCSGGRVAAVDCPGTTCQYTYRWVSSPGRTGGPPSWTVSVTATWEFSYTTSGAGSTTGPRSATWRETLPVGSAAVSIGQWSTVGGNER